jgi:hypothetical protein
MNEIHSRTASRSKPELTRSASGTAVPAVEYRSFIRGSVDFQSAEGLLKGTLASTGQCVIGSLPSVRRLALESKLVGALSLRCSHVEKEPERTGYVYGSIVGLYIPCQKFPPQQG